MGKDNEKEKLENARKLKENCVPLELIAKSLGLSLNDLESIG